MKARNAAWWLVLLVATVFYAVPMLAMARFAFQRIPVIKLSWGNVFDKWTAAPLVETLLNPDFHRAGLLSLGLAVATAALTVLLLVPTMTFAHLRSPRMRRFIELTSVLPFVVPAKATAITAEFRKVMERWNGEVGSIPTAYSAKDIERGPCDVASGPIYKNKP